VNDVVNDVDQVNAVDGSSRSRAAEFIRCPVVSPPNHPYFVVVTWNVGVSSSVLDLTTTVPGFADTFFE
jgi:hypothetical protein